MRWRDWLGVGERRWKKAPDEEVQPAKTVWDFLQLLVVPVMLAVIAILFTASQASRDRSREEAARQDATLQSYLNELSDLMLDRRLLKSSPESAVRKVARVETLTALRRLDSERKTEVVRFLLEAGLLRRDKGPLVSLDGADLRGVDLRLANFEDGASFVNADLENANFDGAWFSEVLFNGADLHGASFRSASLAGVDFYEADLSGTRFDRGTLGERDFETSFVGACLDNTSFADVTFALAVIMPSEDDFPDPHPNERRAVVDFYASWGDGVDFSRANGLSRVEGQPKNLTNVNFAETNERPHGWGPSGAKNPRISYSHPCP